MSAAEEDKTSPDAASMVIEETEAPASEAEYAAKPSMSKAYPKTRRNCL